MKKLFRRAGLVHIVHRRQTIAVRGRQAVSLLCWKVLTVVRTLFSQDKKKGEDV